MLLYGLELIEVNDKLSNVSLHSRMKTANLELKYKNASCIADRQRFCPHLKITDGDYFNIATSKQWFVLAANFG